MQILRRLFRRRHSTFEVICMAFISVIYEGSSRSFNDTLIAFVGLILAIAVSLYFKILLKIGD